MTTFSRTTIRNLFDARLMLETSVAKFATDEQKQVLASSLVCAQAARSRLNKTPEVVEIADCHHSDILVAVARDDMEGLESALDKHLS